MLRFGVLGVARVVPYGLLQPAGSTAGVSVEVVASRSASRAGAFASQHKIPRAVGSYAALIDDPEIDAVYIALPNALHEEWAIRALEAGKHVLCQKPLAPTSAIAERMFAVARSRGKVLHEANQMRYQGRVSRQLELIENGDFGPVRRIDSCVRVPRVPMQPDDFRLSYELGGGSGLDVGCYAVSSLMQVAREEPRVVSARCRRASPQVDRWMRANIQLPSGVTGSIECGFRGFYTLRIAVDVTCERGWIRWHKQGITWKRNGEVTTEPLPEVWQYQRQLTEFARACRNEPADLASPDEVVAAARVLDAMYAKAGLAARGLTS